MVAFGAEAVRVDEVGVLHADLGGVAVHQRGEGLFAAGHMLGQCDRGIVAGLDRHALFHVFQTRGLVDRETAVAAVGAGAALAPGALAHHDLVVALDLAVLDFGSDHVGRHHLGDAGRRQLLVDIFTGQHLPGGVIHQDPRLGHGRSGCGRNRDGGRRSGNGRRRLRRRRLGADQAKGERGHRSGGEAEFH